MKVPRIFNKLIFTFIALLLFVFFVFVDLFFRFVSSCLLVVPLLALVFQFFLFVFLLFFFSSCWSSWCSWFCSSVCSSFFLGQPSLCPRASADEWSVRPKGPQYNVGLHLWGGGTPQFLNNNIGAKRCWSPQMQPYHCDSCGDPSPNESPPGVQIKIL